MSAFIDILSELELAIGRNELSNSPNVSRRKLIEQTNSVRASEIERSFNRNKMISPAWLSTMGITEVQLTDAMDDPGYVQGCTDTGRIIIPEVIPLHFDDENGPRGIHLVASPDYRQRYYYLKLDSILRREKIGETYNGQNNHFYLSNITTLYLKPYRPIVQLQLVLFDPLQGYIIDNSFKKSGELIIADDYTQPVTYQVVDGTIEHDGATYMPGDTFVAVERTYSGNGKVKLNEIRRKVNLNDRYPIDSDDMRNNIVRRVLLEHYAIELQTPVDIKNDHASGTASEESVRSIKDSQ